MSSDTTPPIEPYADAGALSPAPYKVTPVFTEVTLPDALRNSHSTKAGVWGVIRILEGHLRYEVEGKAGSDVLDRDNPGLVRPQELHRVAPLGAMRMQVEFHRAFPAEFASKRN